jgi:hypothetical protein
MRAMVTRQIASMIATALVVLLGVSSTAGADPPSGGSGTWQKHEYSFVFMGFTSTYSCDGLADKLKRLLLAAGARADAKAQAGPCATDFGHPDKLARSDLVFYTLMPDPPDKSADGSHTPGTWRSVALTQRSPRELGLGDCELVEQFREQLLPLFATRGIEDQTTCIPHQDSGSVINLKFESFTAAVAAKSPK